MPIRPLFLVGLLAVLPAASTLSLAAGISLSATALWAQDQPVEAQGNGPAETQVFALSDIMLLGPLFDVLEEEGAEYGRTLESDMFPSGGGPGWAAAVAAIYDAQILRRRFDAILTRRLSDDPTALAEMEAFFGSERGQRILQLEIDARRALLDEGVKEAAEVASDRMSAENDPRLGQITRLIEANDLIEMNVAGSLTGNLAFLQGLSDEGPYGAQVDPDQLMTDVWGQEDQIRSDTSTWLYSYLALAYGPLGNDDLEAYISFSQTEAGRKLNLALFAAFNDVFEQVSHELGRAAGRAMQGSDI